MAKKDILNQRSDKFTIVLNDSGADLFKNARNIVRKMSCNELLCILFIACIKHDKDYDAEQQQLKTTHYHLVIMFDRAYRLGTILTLLCDTFNCNANQVSIDKCSSMIMQTRYLIHLDDFDKYQYDKTDIVCNDTDYLNKCFNYIRKIVDIDDLIVIVRQFPVLTELMSRIGYDNYKKYRLVISDIRRELNYNRY